MKTSDENLHLKFLEVSIATSASDLLWDFVFFNLGGEKDLSGIPSSKVVLQFEVMELPR